MDKDDIIIDINIYEDTNLRELLTWLDDMDEEYLVFSNPKYRSSGGAAYYQCSGEIND